ncbi:MAG: hypothetical protein ACTHN5_02800 [Phycisphaerae bacterium]
MRGFAAILALFLGLPLLAGCESQTTPSPETAKLMQQEHPIDGMSRDVAQREGGSVHDPYTWKPPPVRRDYASER